MDKFKTIMNNATTKLEEKKSKFITNVFYVENQKQVEEILKNVKKEFSDATHNCYAYRIIEEDTIKDKSSDDGEPNGTAGYPILNVLLKNEILNVLVIVTRYFGGTLLGTGGLIRAYSDSTITAIEKAEIAIQEIGKLLEIVIDYKDFEKLKYYCNKNEINITNVIYENRIKCIIEINCEKEKELEEKQKELNILENNLLEIIYIRTKYKNNN